MKSTTRFLCLVMLLSFDCAGWGSSLWSICALSILQQTQNYVQYHCSTKLSNPLIQVISKAQSDGNTKRYIKNYNVRTYNCCPLRHKIVEQFQFNNLIEFYLSLNAYLKQNSGIISDLAFTHSIYPTNASHGWISFGRNRNILNIFISL